ncbi:hypothetical protein BDV33DRAFT_152603 [Aspergillus novoparasiticus]|uniref:Uncharacterized protein n=1 Tax=Aspergillus novoparasiticus TaxID=986946 RepID=A0A5N6EG30_9EURO|nr:hypothetical protein BDV33DRAFT_152603 [Aspergillus novoparasiticus]
MLNLWLNVKSLEALSLLTRLSFAETLESTLLVDWSQAKLCCSVVCGYLVISRKARTSKILAWYNHHSPLV